MLRLMKLEAKKYKMQNYIRASVIGFFILVAFEYFISGVSRAEHNPVFQNYDNIFKFIGMMTLLVFTILAAVMFSRLIIEEYQGKKMYLLFSYPTNPKKIFLAKLLLVLCFIIVSTFLSYILAVSIFCISESISPIVNDKLTSIKVIQNLSNVFNIVIIIPALGTISMVVGYMKKSVPINMVLSFVLVGILGNTLSGFSVNKGIGLILEVIIVISAIIAVGVVLNNISKKEI